MYRRIEQTGCDRCEEQDFVVFKREFEAIYPNYMVVPTEQYARWDANIISRETGEVKRRVEFKSALKVSLVESPISNEKFLVDWKKRDDYGRPTILKNIRIRKEKVDKLVEIEKTDGIPVYLVWLFANQWVVMHVCNDFKAFTNPCYNGRDTNEVEVQYSIPLNLAPGHNGRIQMNKPYQFEPPKYIQSNPIK